MSLRRGNYGYDAPYALIAFTGVATVATIAAVAMWMTNQRQFFRIAVFYAGFFGLKLDGRFLFLTASAHLVFGITLGVCCHRRFGPARA